MRRPLAAALTVFALTLFAAPAAAAWGKPKEVTVRGRVTEASGEGVAGVPVRVLATRRVVKFLTIESQPAETQVAATTTGPDGFYELTVPKLRDYDFYFLRFYGPDSFDAVKFAVPADVEVTERIQKRRPVVEDVVLGYSVEWDAVQRLVGLYGADSARGQIVRQLGVPDRTERRAAEDGKERETWWYERAGVAYVIEEGRVVDRMTFQPEESPAIARQ
jgi:hypothetical protein